MTGATNCTSDPVKWTEVVRLGSTLCQPWYWAEWNGLRLLVDFSRYAEEWHWSVTREGELPYKSKHGINTARSAAEGKRRAERAAHELRAAT